MINDRIIGGKGRAVLSKSRRDGRKGRAPHPSLRDSGDSMRSFLSIEDAGLLSEVPPGRPGAASLTSNYTLRKVDAARTLLDLRLARVAVCID